MLSVRLKNNFSIVPLNEQWLEIIIKADDAGIGIWQIKELKGPKLRYSASGFLHKSNLYG